MPEPGDAVFVPDGRRFVPTGLARGPWSPAHQHGGAPSSLLARAVEQCEPLDAPHVARLTIDLIRPVPLTPLTVEAKVRRPGRKVQLIEAVIVADGTEVALCRALRQRSTSLDLDDPPPSRRAEVRGPDASDPLDFTFPHADTGFWDAMELRIAAGGWVEPGPAAAWFRLRVPLVAGEEPSPLMRVAAAADFGNGISSAFDRTRFTFVNPDLSIVLHRYPEGAWIGLDAMTFAEPHGVGLAEAALLDRRGRIGRSTQSLLLDERPEP